MRAESRFVAESADASWARPSPASCGTFAMTSKESGSKLRDRSDGMSSTGPRSTAIRIGWSVEATSVGDREIQAGRSGTCRSYRSVRLAARSRSHRLIPVPIRIALHLHICAHPSLPTRLMHFLALIPPWHAGRKCTATACRRGFLNRVSQVRFLPRAQSGHRTEPQVTEVSGASPSTPRLAHIALVPPWGGIRDQRDQEVQEGGPKGSLRL
jgi:hypothetical protein